MNAPGCSYPIPCAGTEDWPTLIAMFEGMGREAQDRADQIRALDDPAEDVRRARDSAAASVYAFAALMTRLQIKPRP